MAVQHPFTPKQWETLLALAESFIPGLDDDEVTEVERFAKNVLVSPNLPQIRKFLKQSAKDCDEFTSYLAKLLSGMPNYGRKRIAFLLDVLSGEKGGFMNAAFTGTFTPFHELERKDRENVLQSWRTAYLLLFQGLLRSFGVLIAMAYLRTSPLARAAIEYPGDDLRNTRVAADTGHSPTFDFLTFNAAEFEQNELEADVIVIGSGAGGGVISAKLARDRPGLRVVILDKGQFFDAKNLPLSEVAAAEQMYEGGGAGFLRPPDQNGAIFAGKAWGGGTAINWAVAWQLQAKVRREWAERYGLEFTETPEFQDCLDYVCERMGVTTTYNKDNIVNSIVKESARRLGFEHKDAPRNTGTSEHSCGYCGYGCPGGKQGSAITWLADAHQAGARCIQNCEVEQILFDKNRAKGVTATINGQKKLIIKAPRVVISAGALNTPCLLLKSGVTHAQLGQNLKLHPSVGCLGYFKNKVTRPCEGAIITTYVTEYADLDARGYGVRVMPGFSHPGFAFFTQPWHGSIPWRQNVLRFQQSAYITAVARDRDSSGSIRPDPTTNKPLIDYKMAKFDINGLTEGIIAICKLLVEGGADEIQPLSPENMPSYKPSSEGITDPSFKAYVTELRRRTVGSRYASAHQMGTCRMGSDPTTSVVDIEGRVRGYSGLYVADASLFPTSSGVNPMVTIMGLAEWVGRKLVEHIKWDSTVDLQ